jgi:hypothetical protein
LDLLQAHARSGFVTARQAESFLARKLEIACVDAIGRSG